MAVRETARPLLKGTSMESPLLPDNPSPPRTNGRDGSEFRLLWALAWPLFFQTLANEAQMVPKVRSS